MAKSASSSRLLKTWEVVRDRQARDNDKYQWKPGKMSGGGDPHQGHGHHHHDHHHHHHHDDHLELVIPEEESAMVIFEQRRKFRQTQRGMRDKYDEVEDTLFDGRRPPCLRTAGGEVLQGIYPSESYKWLGVPPRFGSVVPQEKYVGGAANELSKWISTDKMARLKSEKSIFDQPVRAYLKIDDTIDVNRMTGSHFRYIDMPLDEDMAQLEHHKTPAPAIMDRHFPPIADSESQSEQESMTESERAWQSDNAAWEKRLARAEASEEGSVQRSETSKDREDVYVDNSLGLALHESRQEMEEESEGSAASGTQRPDQRSFKELENIFDRHVKNMGRDVQREIVRRHSQVEHDWRNGQTTRPATLRFRR